MFKQKSSLYLSMATILFAFILLTLTGCDSKSTSDSASAGTTVSITSSRTTLNLSDAKTAFIVVTVLDGGSGLADQDVSFSVDPTAAGTFTVSDTTTDATGEALTMFTAGSTGTVTVTASINSGAYTRTINLTVSTSSSGSDGALDISISPSLLVATGYDTARVDIAVLDGSGNPAADSTLVKITAGEKFVDIDSNGYWSEGIDSLVFDANGNDRWDGFGIIPSVAYTGGGTGTVSINYISGSEAVTVYIKVTVDDNGIFTSDEATLQVTPDALLYSIFLASDSMQLSVKHTGGIETGMLRATAYDVSGNPMPEGVPIVFFITDGPGGGEHLAAVEPDSTFQTVTNSQGIASCPIHSGTISGTIRIRAYNDTVVSNATQVLVSAGPPAYIVIGSDECNVDYWDNVAEYNKIVAVVSDAFLNPVNDSTVVYFSCDEGSMKSHEERTVDHEGIATTLWFAANNVDTADGRVYIMAETSGGTVADTGMFFNSHLCDTLISYGMPSSMAADGNSEAIVMVEGYDFNGNPVINATTFEADATYLTVAGGTLGDGCYTARARVKITSAVLDQDKSLTGANDDGIGATDYIQYWKDGAYSVYACDLLTGNAYSGNSLIDGQTNADPNETIYLSVMVKDRAGNPLGDHTINLSASVGAVTPNTGETNGYGEAGPFTWTAPAGVGSYTITANDVDPRGGIAMLLNVKVEE